MKFDKTRVYTEFTADEVKIGSRGYFSNAKGDMLERVTKESKDYMGELVGIYDGDGYYPFEGNGCYWRYFYLVEEPKEKTKRPCTKEELIEMLKKQGLPMLRSNLNNITYMVEKITDNFCFVYDCGDYNYKELCNAFTLLDGTPLWVEE